MYRVFHAPYFCVILATGQTCVVWLRSAPSRFCTAISLPRTPFTPWLRKCLCSMFWTSFEPRSPVLHRLCPTSAVRALCFSSSPVVDVPVPMPRDPPEVSSRGRRGSGSHGKGRPNAGRGEGRRSRVGEGGAEGNFVTVVFPRMLDPCKHAKRPVKQYTLLHYDFSCLRVRWV